VEVEINENPRGLLEGLGYQLMFEYVLDGYRWHIVDVSRYDWLESKKEAKTEPPDIFPYYITICLPIRLARSASFELVRDQAPLKLFDDGFVVELFGFARDQDVNALTKELDLFANKLVPYVLVTSIALYSFCYLLILCDLTSRTVNLMKLDGTNLQQLKKIIDSRGHSSNI
jgi:hypothetical protein